MAVDPHKQSTEVAKHDTHGEGHPKWGWTATFPRATQVAGWLTVIILLLLTTATHYNFSGQAWLIGFAIAIAIGLVLDLRARRNAWRR